MTIKNVLVVLNSYPDPTPNGLVESSVAVGSCIGVHLSAISCEVRIRAPRQFLADALIDVPGIIAAEADKSKHNAKTLLETFDRAAEQSGISHEVILQKCLSTDIPELLIDYSRHHDLTIFPMPESGDQWQAETLIFQSGRPVLILPELRGRPFALGTVAVAWDGSRAAARAISDAISLLEKAKHVRIVTVLNEKSLDNKHSAEELAKNLSRHGIDVVLDKVDAGDRLIGDVLEAYTVNHSVDLLVMGAYGHSRLREFFLGGATASVLKNPQLPVFLSH